MAYDWLLIKREYVQGYPDKDGQIICPTLEQLCERHGCSLSTIMKKSASEKWPTERKIFGRKKDGKSKRDFGGLCADGRVFGIVAG